MRVKIETYRRGDARLLIDKRAYLYLKAQGIQKIRESNRDVWEIDFGHSDDASSFVTKFLPKHVEIEE